MVLFSEYGCALPRHTRTFRLCSHDRTNPIREVEVYASPEEITFLEEQGYLVRERLFTPEQVEHLRRALEAVASREAEGGLVGLSQTRRFGGLFLRHLMDKHPVFLELFRYAPTLSVSRAVLGPQVQVLPMTARISYPDQPNQETHWHFHQRVIPNPLPRFFARPHVIDCLIYLDEVNEANGLLCVMPGSHHWIHEELTPDDYGDKPGQVQLRLPTGSCVLIHGGLWHRALPTTPQGTLRRMLILPYAASWLKLPSFGLKPENGLMQMLLQDADTETLELLGVPDGLY
ncbi:MAG TPA: phytanoyl-CoA dioxygenase family protein [Chthonomonadaceae bacterium]|nr:phytanoyl-CoA dioxygenase family protein [Chthonomonadaceae bacterium]